MSYNLRSRKVTKTLTKRKGKTIEKIDKEEIYQSDEDEVDNLTESTITESSDEEEVQCDESTTLDSSSCDETLFDDTLDESLVQRIRGRTESLLEETLDGDYNGYMESPYLMGEWKSEIPDLNSEDEKKLDSELEDLISEMRRELPTIRDILNSDLSRTDKKECLYLLDLMKNSEPYDSIFNEHRKILMTKMKKKSKRQIELERLFKSEKSYETRILELDASDHIKTTLLHYLGNISTVQDSEQQSRKTKLEAMLELPYDKIVTPVFNDLKPHEFLQKASEQLDKELYGMDKVKRKFLSVLSKRIQALNDPNVSNKGCAICLAGPPGVGKTHISSVFAKCLGLPFYQITIGGAKDSSVLIGGDNQWVGASCGQIAYSLQQMKCSNGVLFIDEIDKVSNNGNEIYDALNHVIDFTSNHSFEDVYFREIKLDLSRMWFVLSMNDKNLLPSYVLDRLMVIDVDPYEYKEKLIIAKDFMLPKFLDIDGVTFSDEAMSSIIKMSHEKGVREISNIIEHICAKISMHVLMKDVKGFKHCELKKFSIPYIIKSSDVHTLTSDMKRGDGTPLKMYS